MKRYRSALITGASSGLGATFAEQLAREGLDLVLVARSEDKLAKLAAQLAKNHGIRADAIGADLSKPGCGAALLKEVQARGLAIDLLVNNAGFTTAGTFHKLDAEREHQEILLNTAAVVDLAHAFLPPMLTAGRGGIVNIASLAAFQPLPYMSVYAATKAFVLSFSESLRGELRGKGIRVLCVCPGPVDTPFFEASGNPRLRGSVPKHAMMKAEMVVAGSLKALKDDKSVYVPGYANKVVALSSRFIPRAVVTAVTSRAIKR